MTAPRLWMIPIALAALVACKGDPETEDCTAAGDEDGDELANCDDPECAADPACVPEDTDVEDTDVELPVPEAPDNCRDEDDNDDDGTTDCADPDCASLPVCHYYGWEEHGAATVVPETSYTGTVVWKYPKYTPDKGPSICEYTFDARDVVAPDLVECEGCDFAFMLQFENGRTTAGDCVNAPNAPQEEGAGGEDFQYGIGFDADYTYTTQDGDTYDFPNSMMYFIPPNEGYGDYWLAGYFLHRGAELPPASFDGSAFSYEITWGYYYYE